MGIMTSSKLSGVQNSKLNKKFHIFLNEENNSTALYPKRKTYLKPKCSFQVLLRIAFWEVDEMTGMDAWQTIRKIFPYYVKCHNFSLKSVLQKLKSNADFRCTEREKPSGSLRKSVFYSFKDDVSYSYDLSEIIGHENSLSCFTIIPEDKFKSYLRRNSSLKETLEPLPSAIPNSPVKPSPLKSSTSTDKGRPHSRKHRINRFGKSQGQIFRPRKRLQKRSFGKLSSLLVKVDLSKKSSKAKYFANEEPAPNLTISNSKMKDDELSSGNSEINKAEFRTKDSFLELDNGGISTVDLNLSSGNQTQGMISNQPPTKEEVIPSNATKSQSAEVGHIPSVFNKECHNHTLLSVNPIFQQIEQSTEGFNFDPLEPQLLDLNTTQGKLTNSTEEEFKSSVSKLKHEDRSGEIVVTDVGDKYVENFCDETYNCDSGIETEVEEHSTDFIQSSSLLKIYNEPLPGRLEPLNAANTESENSEIAELFNPLKEKSEEDIKVIYTRLKIEEPDSTDSLSGYEEENTMRGREKRSVSNSFSEEWKCCKSVKVEKDEDLVSSSNFLNEFYEDDDGTPTCDTVSRDFPLDENSCLNQIDITKYKTEYDWIVYDKEKKIVCCKSCNNEKLCLDTETEVSLLLASHKASKLHTLYPFINIPKALNFIYHFIKKGCIRYSQVALKDEFLTILMKFSMKDVSEETLFNVVELLSEYEEEQILKHIRESNQLYSLSLNFCRGLAFVRTLNGKGKVVEALLVLKCSEDRSVVGFLNSVNLNVNRLIFFSELPECGNCKNCLGKPSLLTETATFPLPPLYPTFEEVLEIICEHPYLVNICAFMEKLLHLYKKFPAMFMTIEKANKLNTESCWDVLNFVKENYNELVDVCRGIFEKKGDIIGLSLAHNKLNLNEELVETLMVIKYVHNEIRDLQRKEGSFMYGISSCRERIRQKSESLISQIKEMRVKFEIKDYLIAFLTELHRDFYFSNKANEETLIDFLDSKFLRSLKNLKDVKDSSMKVLSYFEKFTNAETKDMLKELSSFGEDQIHSFSSSSPKVELNRVIDRFSDDLLLKERFPVTHRFYSILSLLPVFRMNNCHGSWHKINMLVNLLTEKFGVKIGKYIATVYFSASISGTSSLEEYVKQFVPKKPP